MHARHDVFAKWNRGQVVGTVINLANAIEDRDLQLLHQTANQFWTLVVDHYRFGIRLSHEEVATGHRCFRAVDGDGHYASPRRLFRQSLDQFLLDKVLVVTIRHPGDGSANQQAG